MLAVRPGEIAMPFKKRHEHGYWKEDGKEDEPDILLRQVGPNAFQLIDSFAYEVPGSGKPPYEVPGHDLKKPPKLPDDSGVGGSVDDAEETAEHREDDELPAVASAGDAPASPPQIGNSTDLASVPFVFWWFIASHGRHTRAALLHDHLVDAPTVITRRDADTAFRLALEESKVPWLRRWLMWTAVSLATNAKSGWGRLYVLVFLLFLLTFAFALLYWAFAEYAWWPLGFLPLILGWGERWPFASADWWPFVEHGSLPWGGRPWLPALAVAVTGLWGARRWLLAMVAIVLVGPPTVFVLIALGAVWLVNLVAAPFVWILSGAAFKGERLEIPGVPRPYRQQSRPF